MNVDALMNAIGDIDERKIRDAKAVHATNKRISLKRVVALIAAIILCITISVPVLAATVDPVYQMVYRISPPLAQMWKPVQLSCENNGIRMEVLSAAVYENEAAICIALQDMTEQNRIDETTDLFDSYHINRAFDSSASCSMVSFDEDTKTATFLISIGQWGNREIGGEKITFWFTEFLSHKSQFEGELTGLDLLAATEAAATQTPEAFRGGGEGLDYESRYEQNCLIPVEGGILSPVDGVTVTNIGFVDDKLHVQLYFEDILSYDNHGYIRMVDKDGNPAESVHFSFWDEEKVGSFEEIIYDISPEDIGNYQAYGYFVTCKNLTEGYWQVTFPLEDKD